MLFVWWAVALCAIFLIGMTKSGFGSGVGLMVVPMMALAMPHILPERGERTTLGLVLPLLVAGDFIAVYQYRKLFSRAIIRRLMRGTIVGLVIGGGLLAWFHNRPPATATSLIRLEIGAEAVVLVSLHWWRIARRGQTAYKPAVWKDDATGTFAAASSTLAHAAGPIVTLYLLPQQLGRDLFIGTSAIYFFIVNTAKLPVYWYGNLFRDASPLFSLRFLPVVVFGAFFGWWVKSRIHDRLFTTIVYSVTFVLGCYMLIDAGMKLFGPLAPVLRGEG
jgi:uncharacterized membrane protein YfcA